MEVEKIKNSWELQTLNYRKKVSDIPQLMDRTRNELGKIPRGPFSVALEGEIWIKFMSCIIVSNFNRSFDEIQSDFKLQFAKGRYLSASLTCRSLLELYSAVEYVRFEVLQKFATSGDFNAAKRKVDRLFLGTKSGDPMPWNGEESEVNPINVMDFIRCVAKINLEVESDYTFLCDAAHPSNLRHIYLSMAGKTGDNWSNNVFAGHGHSLLKRIVNSATHSTKSIEDSTLAIIQQSEQLFIELGL